VSASGIGRVGGAGRCPIVGAGIVSAAGVEILVWVIDISSPDDHFTAGPHSGVTGSGIGRVGGAGGCPTVRAGIVSPARVQREAIIKPAPDGHFTVNPDCRVTGSGVGRIGGAGGYPTVRAGIISPARVQIGGVITRSTPDNHFAAGPDRCVRLSR
jgi:hypothetical protein